MSRRLPPTDSRPCPKCGAPRNRPCRRKDGSLRVTFCNERSTRTKASYASTGINCAVTVAEPKPSRKTDKPRYTL